MGLFSNNEFSTELDKDGKVISAHYVRIFKGIGFLSGSGVSNRPMSKENYDYSRWTFAYYLNPKANDRSLEKGTITEINRED